MTLNKTPQKTCNKVDREIYIGICNNFVAIRIFLKGWISMNYDLFTIFLKHSWTMRNPEYNVVQGYQYGLTLF